MEIFIGILVLIAVIMIIASILDSPKSAVKQLLGDFSEPKLKRGTEVENHKTTVAKLELELADKLAKDTVRYVVEATTKDGTVFTTTEYEPGGFINNSHYSDRNYYEPLLVYITSRQYAEQFVVYAQNNGTKLVQFGDDYVCISTITKVRLVKTKE